jgi:hypothetical protein
MGSLLFNHAVDAVDAVDVNDPMGEVALPSPNRPSNSRSPIALHNLRKSQTPKQISPPANLPLPFSNDADLDSTAQQALGSGVMLAFMLHICCVCDLGGSRRKI